MKSQLFVSMLLVATMLGCSSSSKTAGSTAGSTPTSPPLIGSEVTVAGALCSLPTHTQLTVLLGHPAEGFPKVPGTRNYSAPNCGFTGTDADLNIEVYTASSADGMRPIHAALARKARQSCTQPSSTAHNERVYRCTITAALAPENSGRATALAEVFRGRSAAIVALRADRANPLPSDISSKLIVLRSLAQSAIRSYGSS